MKLKRGARYRVKKSVSTLPPMFLEGVYAGKTFDTEGDCWWHVFQLPTGDEVFRIKEGTEDQVECLDVVI